MDIGISLILSILVASIVGVLKNTIENLVAGLWLRVNKEVLPNDRVRVKSRQFGEVEGVVKRIGLRNILIETDKRRVLLVQTTRVFDDDIIRIRER